MQIKGESNAENEIITPPVSDSCANGGDPTPKTPIQRQKTIGGRVTKSRASSRNTPKKDYKAMVNPYQDLAAYDSDGQRIRDSEDSGSEDAAGSDGTYGNDAAEEVLTKSEDNFEETVAA